MSKKKSPPAETLPIEPIPAPVPPGDSLPLEGGQETTVTAAEPVAEAVPAEAPPPEAWDAPEILELQVNWPQAEETRELLVTLTVEEQARYGIELADSIDAITALEDRKKAEVDHLKTLIQRKEEEQTALKNIVRQRSTRKPVPCKWVFGVSGRDEFGRFQRDGNYKALVRKDTGEVLECRGITQNDRTMELPLEEPAGGDGTDEPAGGDGTDEPASDDDRTAIMDDYERGAHARRNGMSRAACPLPMGDDRTDWLAGWDDEDETIKEQKAA